MKITFWEWLWTCVTHPVDFYRYCTRKRGWALTKAVRMELKDASEHGEDAKV